MGKWRFAQLVRMACLCLALGVAANSAWAITIANVPTGNVHINGTYGESYNTGDLAANTATTGGYVWAIHEDKLYRGTWTANTSGGGYHVDWDDVGVSLQEAASVVDSYQVVKENTFSYTIDGTTYSVPTTGTVSEDTTNIPTPIALDGGNFSSTNQYTYTKDLTIGDGGFTGPKTHYVEGSVHIHRDNDGTSQITNKTIENRIDDATIPSAASWEIHSGNFGAGNILTAQSTGNTSLEIKSAADSFSTEVGDISFNGTQIKVSGDNATTVNLESTAAGDIAYSNGTFSIVSKDGKNTVTLDGSVSDAATYGIVIGAVGETTKFEISGVENAVNLTTVSMVNTNYTVDGANNVSTLTGVSFSDGTYSMTGNVNNDTLSGVSFDNEKTEYVGTGIDSINAITIKDDSSFTNGSTVVLKGSEGVTNSLEITDSSFASGSDVTLEGKGSQVTITASAFDASVVTTTDGDGLIELKSGTSFVNGGGVYAKGGDSSITGTGSLQFGDETDGGNAFIKADGGNNRIELSDDIYFSTESGIETWGGDTTITLTGDGTTMDPSVLFDDGSYITTHGSGNTITLKKEVSFADSNIKTIDGANNSILLDGDGEAIDFANSDIAMANGGNRLELTNNVSFSTGSGIDVGSSVNDEDNRVLLSDAVSFDGVDDGDGDGTTGIEVTGNNTTISLKNNVIFDNGASIVSTGARDENYGSDAANVLLQDSVVFDNGSSITLNDADNYKVRLNDDVSFSNASSLEAFGDNAEIKTEKNVSFEDSTLGLSGSGNLLEITDNSDFAGQSLIYLEGPDSKLWIHGNTTEDPDGVQIGGTTEVRVSGGENEVLLEGVTTIKEGAVVNVKNDGNTVTLRENTTVKGTAAVNVIDNENTVDVTGNTKFTDTASLNVGGHTNTVTVDGNANFNSGATLNVDGDKNTVAITGNTIFEGEAATNIDGNGNTGLTISGNATYKDKAQYNLNGRDNLLVVSGQATFGSGTGGNPAAMPDDYAGITSDGYNNMIYLTEQATFKDNSMVFSTGGSTELYVLDQVDFQNDSEIHLLAGNGRDGIGDNTLILRLTDKTNTVDGPYLEKWDDSVGKFIKTDKDGNAIRDDDGNLVYGGFTETDESYGDRKQEYKTKTTFSGSGNSLVVAGNTWIRDTSNITFLKDSKDDKSIHNTTGENDGTDNTVIFTEYSRFTADMFMQGTSNRLEISGRTMYQGWTEMAGDGNQVLIDMDEGLINFRADNNRSADYYNITGQVVFQDGNGFNTNNKNNTVWIKNGQLTNNEGSVIGSDEYFTKVNIDGGQTNLLVSGAAGSHYQVQITDQWMDESVGTLNRYDRFVYGSGQGGEVETTQYEGNIYNIRAKSEGALKKEDGDFSNYVADYLANDAVTGLNNSIHYIGTSSTNPKTGESVQKVYQSYSILNMSEVRLKENAIVHIGEVRNGEERYAMKNEPEGNTPTDYDRNLDRLGLGNQLSTDNLYITGGSKLMIHEDEDRVGQKLSGAAAAADVTRNVVNYTYIQDGSELTIDRTTIHGTVAGKAQIHVSTGGVLYGFAEWKDGDRTHDPLRANLVGDLYVDSGGLLQYFDADFYNHRNAKDYTPSLEKHHIFDSYNFNVGVSEQLRGVVMKVESAADGTGGTTTFANGSVIRTRLFADSNGLNANVVNNITGTVNTSYSDYLMSTGSDFSAIVDPNYTLTGLAGISSANKVQYQPVFGYHSDLASKLQYNIFDCDTKEQSYYFKVIDGDSTIDALVGADDANHLFNNQILHSDMLGAWDFLKSGDNQDITLRFRLLAEHPINGGLAANVLDKNNLKMAQYIDEIRYPFQTGFTDLDFGKDPSAVQLDFNEATGAFHPGYEGFGGSMSDWYAANPTSGGVTFDNYTAGYIRDWENFLLGVQEELACATNVDDILKQLQPEVYSSLTDTNFDIVSAFIRNRERNSVVDRWRAQPDDNCRRCDRRSVCPHKSVDPSKLQFWASGFGADGKYQRRDGSNSGNASRTSYGYDTQLWGGAVGAVREWDKTYVGVTIGYATQTNKWSGLAAQTKTKAHMVEALYGRRLGRDNKGFVEIYGDFAWNDQNISRNIQAGSYRSNMNAKFHDIVIGGGVRAGYLGDLGCGWQIMPTVAVNVLHSRSSAISEEKTNHSATGSATALVVDKNSVDRTVVRVPIMAKVSKVFRVNECGLEIVPEVHAGVIANVGDSQGKVRAKFAGNPVDNRWFSSTSEGKGEWEGVFGGSVEIGRRDQYYLSGSYDYSTSANSKEHSFSVATGVSF